ncbi:hypothetical protein AMTRI_Chr06g194740 [Amborella trichopoda]|uniref:CBS domain-containing protein CBSX6 n=1 Tax=Amborella trichopoda TaxID=13333 RepID=UPI0005D44737|nr:CBS domain-containing protein CBSX6 [Amborella trichopoda]|eukprot:XP_011624945.1 CBS domain-containing protein CBSX6 [Amborella trichopoda]
MAAVFLYHVVGDLTVGKPELQEFYETESVEMAIKALGDCTESAIMVWKKRKGKGIESGEMKQQRFVGILSALDVIGYLAKVSGSLDHESALKTAVSEVVVSNTSILKEVDPGTRLIDALEMMKQGVRRLLVPRSVAWKGMSKRFSILYNGKWLNNPKSPSNWDNSPTSPSTSSNSNTGSGNNWCVLSREDVVRFVIDCLGALAPLPLCPISTLGVLSPSFPHLDASSPAIMAASEPALDPSAVAIVEPLLDGSLRIVGEISAYKLCKCDYLSAAWALANLNAGQFVSGIEASCLPPIIPTSAPVSPNESPGTKPRKFSSKNVGFFNTEEGQVSPNGGAGMYRGRTTPLTCRSTSSLAAVMAQMLSHRATHVWVTHPESEDMLVGIVTYTGIISAITKPPNSVAVHGS